MQVVYFFTGSDELLVLGHDKEVDVGDEVITNVGKCSPVAVVFLFGDGHTGGKSNTNIDSVQWDHKFKVQIDVRRGLFFVT